MRIRKDKSGSHESISNKGTLTDSNTDVMPNESIILCKGFLGSTGTDFDDSWAMFSTLCQAREMKIGGNSIHGYLSVAVYLVGTPYLTVGRTNQILID